MKGKLVHVRLDREVEAMLKAMGIITPYRVYGLTKFVNHALRVFMSENSDLTHVDIYLKKAEIAKLNEKIKEYTARIDRLRMEIEKLRKE